MTEVIAAPVDVEAVRADFERIVAAVSQVVLGKPAQVRDAVRCLLAAGHLLIEDVPGVGKTSLARALAGAIGGQWRRVQFTADLLPSDVTGVAVYDGAGFVFKPGPVFTNVLVADEINRASPKAQSALLEVMEEQTVTVDGVTHPVPAPFIVVATQNPVDLDGTYPLPEAQLDRFTMRLTLGYPEAADELAVLAADRTRPARPAPVAPVVDLGTVRRHIATVRSVRVSGRAAGYIVEVARAVRAHPDVALGVSTRAVVLLQRLAQAGAAAAGRGFVTADDIAPLFGPVFDHRIAVTPDAELRGVQASQVVRAAVAAVPVPRS